MGPVKLNGPSLRSASMSLASALSTRYQNVRHATERLAAPLSPEDCAVQSMPDCSPAKWHLAHTSWFFETFVLEPTLSTYRHFQPQFRYLFNSYYQTVGAQYQRPQRALLTRPSLADVRAYRQHVDEQMARLFAPDAALAPALLAVIELGLHHEQQHQELLLTDIKHLFSFNPLHPAYQSAPTATGLAAPLRWQRYAEGVQQIGYDGEGFCFDNEAPRHRAFLNAFEIASRPVINREYLEFMRAGGYSTPTLWLSDGWHKVQQEGWQAPLYWHQQDGQWFTHTLNGWQTSNEEEPVCHLSYYEADAFARWSGARLPTEAEWEIAAANLPVSGNFVESGVLHPQPATSSDGVPSQMFGDVWEWTQSAYTPYPGYQPSPGALGEYNGKFMCNQLVLRGGSCVSPQSHLRASYRNFFPPEARWQFSGLRLARDVG
ncbi:MAG: ergothioneine biosynthesis protein EgtB [Acidobacteria bacterium]|nr:ergothioneine biosynthesis protein EgtB [Acidobacteriota bacterium]